MKCCKKISFLWVLLVGFLPFQTPTITQAMHTPSKTSAKILPTAAETGFGIAHKNSGIFSSVGKASVRFAHKSAVWCLTFWWYAFTDIVRTIWKEYGPAPVSRFKAKSAIYTTAYEDQIKKLQEDLQKSTDEAVNFTPKMQAQSKEILRIFDEFKKEYRKNFADLTERSSQIPQETAQLLAPQLSMLTDTAASHKKRLGTCETQLEDIQQKFKALQDNSTLRTNEEATSLAHIQATIASIQKKQQELEEDRYKIQQLKERSPTHKSRQEKLLKRLNT